MGAPLGPAECVVHLGRSYPHEDPSCSGPVPTAKTTLNPAHVRPERRALQNEPRLDDPSCSGPVPTAKTTLNPAHVRPERRALQNEPRLDDPSCSGPVPTAKTTLNPAHVRPERRALQNEPRLDDTIKALKAGAAAARQPHGLGDAGGARGLAPAPEDWSEGPATRLLGRGDRDRAPAAPGLWSALAANRRSAALTHDPARGERRCAGPHHVFPAQPWPGTRYGAGASPGERAGSRRDRRDRPEGLRRGRVAGGEARCARQADLAQASSGH